MAASVIGYVAPDLERFLNRHVLGIAPYPDTWPQPHDCAQLRVPSGMDVSDSTGEAWVLSREHMPAWHRRRTAIGAQAYRFAHNREFDCGWRLANVAARFIQTRLSRQFDVVTMMPPPQVSGSQYTLPWLVKRVAESLEMSFRPNLFIPTAPYAEHPDIARFLATPVTDLFTFSRETDTQIHGATVLLADWRRHTGHAQRVLADQLKRKGATVVRFTWLD